MRIIIFLLFLSFTATAQVSELTGTLNVLSATGTDPNFTVTGSFNSTSGFFATDVDTTMRVVARYVNGTTHRRNIYRITQRTAVGSNLTLTLVRESGISTPFFPTGTHAIVAKTETGLLYDAPNVSQELESYINNYNLNKVAGETIDTAFYQNGAVKIITSDSTVYTAAIPVVTTALNGLMPNTDYKRIKNVYTQITSTGQSVNINMDNGYNYYINIIGDNGGIGLPTKSGSFVSGDKLDIFFYNQSANPRNVIFPGQYYKYADGSPVDTVTIQNADALGMSFIYTQGNIWYLVENPFTQDVQVPIQFVDETSALGTKGTVDTLVFTGGAVTATRANNKMTVNITSSSINQGVSFGEMLVWDSLAQLWVRTPFVRSNISNGNTAIGGIAPTTNKLDVSGTIGINSVQALRLASTNAVYGNSPATFTNGTNNLVVGIGAGSAMTGADESTIVGQAAGASITSGNGNTLLGYSAGNALFGGYDNTLIGRNSGKLITQGYYNIAVGQNSMANADNPTHSIAIGKDALSNTYYTRHNIAIGTDAGRKLNNNNNNLYSEYSIYLGSYTSSFADSCQKEIVIGYQAESIGSNSAVLGSQLWTDSTALFGQLKLVDYTGTNYNNTNPGHLLVTNSTGYVGKIPVSSLSNIVRDTCFSVNIINGGADQTLWVCANGTGITAAYNSGELQIIAANPSVNVKSADFKFGAATVQSTPDAGGATNWVRVKFTQTKGNTGYSDIRVPVVQKVALPGTGSLGLANAASVDIDNNPSVSVVECGFNMIMLRVAGIVAGGNGYLLKFTGVH